MYKILVTLLAVVYSSQCSANFGVDLLSESFTINLEAAAVEPQPIIAGRFESLIDAAAYYSSLTRRGWRPLSQGPMLRLGQRHQQAAELRALLGLYGDYQRPKTGRLHLNRFDRGLAQALRRFQRRHGLQADAVLGPATRKALNVHPDIRAYQLLLNYERQRSLQQSAPERYVQVNLPEYRLRLYQDDQTLLEMKTIVGMQSRRTPVLQSEIRSLVVNPAWNVPRSIATKDIVPKWKQNASYLDDHNMRIVSGWGRERIWIDQADTSPDRLYRGREYQRIYQMPGRKNALGAIKFDFPNKHAVYLHDTPSKSLFNKDQRALSSGCIRVENPRLLAQYLLQPQQLKPKLEQALAESKTQRIRLSKPVELYLTYWTAWLDQQQHLQFREDIYQQDPLLAEAMALAMPQNDELEVDPGGV